MLTMNNKHKRDGIVALNMPPEETCSNKCKYCYVNKWYRYPSVRPALRRNFEASKTPHFVEQIQSELRPKHRYVRIHSSGDFYRADRSESIAYLQKWISLAERNPDRVFYAYTKEIDLFEGPTRAVDELPPNFRIIYSLGGKHGHLIDVKRHLHARIFKSLAEMKKAGYVDCSVSDLVAATTKSLKIGLILH